jgi:hypothetical protein
VKRIEVCCLYIQRQHNETHQTLSEREGKSKRGNGNVEGVFRVLTAVCMCGIITVKYPHIINI